MNGTPNPRLQLTGWRPPLSRQPLGSANSQVWRQERRTASLLFAFLRRSRLIRNQRLPVSFTKDASVVAKVQLKSNQTAGSPLASRAEVIAPLFFPGPFHARSIAGGGSCESTSAQPNPRLQRTRSASPPSPLSRQPLGVRKFLAAFSLCALVLMAPAARADEAVLSAGTFDIQVAAELG